MKINFTKMQGTGNDYIYINCFEQKIPDPAALAVKMSPRRLSVGADGVILISPSGKADAEMRIFNLDGSEGKMCGNGIRCVGKYLFDNGIVCRKAMTVDTLSGIKNLKITEKNGKAEYVTVDMGLPEFEAKKIPAVCPEKRMVDFPISAAGGEYRITAVSMGNPHAVIFCDFDPMTLDLEKIGPEFEFNPHFPERVNTEFIRVLSPEHLQMRVWERGSGETLACGTGACAAAAAAVLCGKCRKETEITVSMRGGDLIITYAGDGHIYMRGPAVKVYDGVYDYEP